MIARHIINKEIIKSRKILDLGCGKGAWSSLVEGRDFYGIDIDKNNNPEGYKEVLHLDLNFFPLSYENNYFDLIIMKDILEHLVHPIDLLRQASPFLKSNGRIMVKVPDYRSKNAWADYTHIRPYDKKSLIQMVESAGYKVDKVVRLGGYFFPRLFSQGFSWLVVARVLKITRKYINELFNNSKKV